MAISPQRLLLLSISLSVAYNLLAAISWGETSRGLAVPAKVSSPEASTNQFSGCLLLMDDNHFLIEWLAYHYHVLNLRHVIVAIDPRSKTSPRPILNRWANRMNITVWANDEDFEPNSTAFDEAESWVRIKFKSDDPSPELIRHRARQRLFYFHCLQEHKRAHHKWTLLTDTDEFLLLNYQTIAKDRPEEEAPQSIFSPGSVANFLRSEEAKHPESVAARPCIQIPRWRFGTVDHTVRYPPGPFNATDFTTLRWLYHASSTNYQFNRISKTIIDVSRVDWTDLVPVDSIHRPLRKYCGQRKLHIESKDQYLLIHHYLGSWEQYSFRQDAREGKERSQQMYRKTAKLAEEYSQDIVPWLGGFIRENGIESAQFLLSDAGKTIPRSRSPLPTK